MTSKTPRKKPLVMWMLPMTRVLYGLLPVIAASIYLFGWRSLIVIALCNLAGFVTEWLFVRQYGEPVSSAVFVTSTLFALSLPPTLPIWMGLTGVIFGVTFGKMVFGGFGRNPFNPALVGRAFIYVCFPVHMTGKWFEPLVKGAAGFKAFAADAVSGATPLVAAKGGSSIPWAKLLFGCTAGSYGETSAVLILLGGAFIVWKKAAHWRYVAGGAGGFLVLQTLLWGLGVKGAIHPLVGLLSGAFLFGLFFFITEPISGAQTDEGRLIYAALFGALCVVIRTWSAWPEGVMFAVLLSNMFAPILDHGIRQWKTRRSAESTSS